MAASLYKRNSADRWVLLAHEVIPEFYDADANGYSGKPLWFLAADDMAVRVHDKCSFQESSMQAVMNGYSDTWALRFHSRQSFHAFMKEYKDKLCENMGKPSNHDTPDVGGPELRPAPKAAPAAESARATTAPPLITSVEAERAARSPDEYRSFLQSAAASRVENLKTGRGALVRRIEKELVPHMHSLFEQMNAIDWSCLLLEHMDTQETMRRSRIYGQLNAKAECLLQTSQLRVETDRRLPKAVRITLRQEQGSGQISVPAQPSIDDSACNMMNSLDTCYSLMREGGINCLVSARAIVVNYVNCSLARMKQWFKRINIIDWQCLIEGRMEPTDSADRLEASQKLQLSKGNFLKHRATLSKIDSRLP